MSKCFKGTFQSMILQMLWNAVESSWSPVANETGDRNQEGMVYFKLGKLHYLNCKYQEAKSFFEKAGNINIATGSTVSEGSCYLNLGAVLNSLSENIEAKECLEKALAIAKKLNNGRGEWEM